jgi:hypothetical protein
MISALTAIKGASGFVQGASAFDNSSGVTSMAQDFAGANTLGNCIVVDFMWDWAPGAATPTCADSAGNSYTTVFTKIVGGGLCAATQFVAFGVLAGANTVTVSFPPPGPLEAGSGDGPCIAIHEYAGGTAVDTFADGQAVSPGAITLSVTTSAAGDLLHTFSGIVTACPGSPTVTGGSPINPPFLTPSWLLVNEPSIGITDRSKYLFVGQGAQHSFTLQLRQRGVASYTLVSSPGDPTSAPLDYLPTLFQPIYLWDQNNEATDWPGCTDGWALVFAGIIQDYTVRWVGTSGLRFIDVSAVSLEAVFDTVYCDGTDQFVNQTCGSIVAALFNKYENGCPVSLGTIQAGVTVPLFTPQKGQKLSEQFEQLATTSEFIWGVNPQTQQLYFMAPTTTAAPFTLTSTQSLWDSISNKIDGADYRNRQGIKLSDEAFPQSGEVFAGSGQQSLTLMRPVKQVVSAYVTLAQPNFATGTFSGQPSPGSLSPLVAADTITIGPQNIGWSVHNGLNPWVVGQVIVVSGFVFQCTTGGDSASSQPAAFLTQTTQGDTVTDGVAIFTCLGAYGVGAGELASSTYTFVSALDNTQYGQVLIGATLAETVQNLVDAINATAAYGGPPPTGGKGVGFSLPTWEGAQVNASVLSGTEIKVTNKQDAVVAVSSLSTTSSAFSWSGAQTAGGSFPQGSLGPNEPGTISIQVYVQGTNTAAPGLAYTPGSANISLATPLNSGSYLNVWYTRADGGSIEVENTPLVALVAAASHGTGKIQQFSDQSELGIISTSAEAGLQLAQQVLEAFDVTPMLLDVILYQPGILPGQLWTWDLDEPWNVLNGQYFVQEVKAELVPTLPWLDNPNALGAGHYRYTIRVVDAAQAQSYLDTWEGFSGGSSSGGGGAGSSTVPTSGGAVSTQGNYGIDIEVNGTQGSGAVSGIANLESGSGVTVTDLGSGNYQFSAIVSSVPTASKYTASWTAQISVTVTHNLGTTAVLVQVFDGSGNAVIPENVKITSANVVTLTFGASFTGSAVVIGIGSSPVAIDYTTSWSAQTSVTVTHNLGTASVAVLVFDASGNVVTPQNIAITSSTVVTLTFGASFTGSVLVVALASQVKQFNASWTSQTSYEIDHGLGTTAVIVQVYDASGNQVIPENIAVTDANDVTLTFGASFTGGAVIMG